MSWVTNGSENRCVFIKPSQCRSLSEMEGQMVPESGGRCREQTTKHKYANANAAHREQSAWEVICYLGWGMLMSILLVPLPKPGGKSQGLWSLSLSKWSLSSTVWCKSPVAWLRVGSRAVFARLLCWGLSSELAWTIKWNEFGQRTSALFNLKGGSLSYVAIVIYHFFSSWFNGPQDGGIQIIWLFRTTWAGWMFGATFSMLNPVRMVDLNACCVNAAVLWWVMSLC